MLHSDPMVKRMFRTGEKRLSDLVEEATVDANDEEEQMTGFWTCIENSVVCPFHAKVAGEDVQVTELSWEDTFEAICRKGKKTYRLPDR